MRTDTDHLPQKKRRELARIQEILFEEFELAKGPEKNTKKSVRQTAGRILKLVLFGSYRRITHAVPHNPVFCGKRRTYRGTAHHRFTC